MISRNMKFIFIANQQFKFSQSAERLIECFPALQPCRSNCRNVTAIPRSEWANVYVVLARDCRLYCSHLNPDHSYTI
jgi:hypothetical protein